MNHERIQSPKKQKLEGISGLKEKFELLKSKFGAYAPLVLFSLATFLPLHTRAQELKKKSKVFLVDRSERYIFSPNEEREAEKQKEWLRIYIESPKYEERLTREFLHYYNGVSLDALTPGTSPEKIYPTKLPEIIPDDIVELVKTYIERRKKELAAVGTLFIHQPGRMKSKDFPSDPGDYLGFYFSDESRVYIINKSHLSTVEVPGRTVVIKGGSESDDKTVSLHEYSHASFGGEREIPAPASLFLDKLIEPPEGMKEAVGNAREFLPRLEVLRLLLQEAGLYDPNTEEFEAEHIDSMQSHPEIMQNPEVQEIYGVLPENPQRRKEVLIWLMNNFAEAKPVPNPFLKEEVSIG